MKKIFITLGLFLISLHLLGAELTLTEMRLLMYKPPMVLEPGDNPHTIGVEKLIEHMKAIQKLEEMSDDEVVDLAKGLIDRAKNSESTDEKILGSRAVNIYAYYTGYSPSALEFVKDLYYNVPNLKLSARVAIGYFPVDTAIDAYLEIDSKVDDPVEEVKIYGYLSRHTDAIKNHPRSETIVSTLNNRFKETSAPSSVRYLDMTLAALDPEFRRSAARREKLQSTMHSLTERNPSYIRNYFQTQAADLESAD